MTLVITIGIAILLIWYLLSVLAQFPIARWLAILRSHDAFCLIPAWTFFAPRPGTSDLNLLYRDRLVDGSLTPWRAVTVPDPGWARWVWNPHRRRRKCLFDMCQSLQVFAAETRSLERIVLHVAYIALLNFVSSLPKNTLHASTQFMLARTAGDLCEDDAEIVFVSAFHPLH